MSNSSILTGQYVQLHQTPASLGDRLLAQLIDFIIISVYVSGMGLIIDKLPNALLWDDYYYVGTICVVALLIVPTIFYHPACEWFNHGQSLGKKVMNCRVVMADGSTPTLASYLMRWLLYPIEVFVTGGLGVIAILFSERNQRFGDMAAGTMVIKCNALADQRVSLNDFYFVYQGYQPEFSEASNLSLRQVELISRTLYNVHGDNREHCLNRLTAKVEEFLGESKPENVRSEDFLFTVLNDYYYYASTIIDETEQQPLAV